MFQFWFNTFFVSQAAVTKEIYEDEPTLKIFEFDSDLRYFDVGKPDLDKAHKDDREKIYPSNFTVSARLKTIFRWWPDMMTSQSNFCPSCLVSDQSKLGEKLINLCVIFSICIFTKRQKSSKGDELTVCSRMRVCVTGQHDW